MANQISKLLLFRLKIFQLICFVFRKFSNKKICQRSDQNWRFDCNPKKVKARSFFFKKYTPIWIYYLEMKIQLLIYIVSLDLFIFLQIIDI